MPHAKDDLKERLSRHRQIKISVIGRPVVEKFREKYGAKGTRFLAAGDLIHYGQISAGPGDRTGEDVVESNGGCFAGLHHAAKETWL